MPNEVFLSHASQDRAFVNKLVSVLRRHGIPVWYSETDVLGAQQWHDEIGAALRRCDWLTLVLSPSATESLWVKREVIYALRQDRFDGRIVPVLYKPCAFDDISWTLPQLQIIDFTSGFDKGCRELLRIWGVGYAPSQSANGCGMDLA